MQRGQFMSERTKVCCLTRAKRLLNKLKYPEEPGMIWFFLRREELCSGPEGARVNAVDYTEVLATVVKPWFATVARGNLRGGLAFLIKNLYYEDRAINIPNTLDLEAQGIKMSLHLSSKDYQRSTRKEFPYGPLCQDSRPPPEVWRTGLKTKLNDHEIIVSFDVKSLFTNINRTLALKELKEYFEVKRQDCVNKGLEIDEMIEGFRLCLDNIYFRYGDKFYRQKDGTAMGCPTGMIIADIVMALVDKKAILIEGIKIWGFYIDDVFAVICKENLDGIMVMLNNLERGIEFTVETEREGFLSFLDVGLTRKEDGSILTSVFRKPTDCGIHLNFNSNNPMIHKRQVIKSLVQRAKQQNTNEDFGRAPTRIKDLEQNWISFKNTIIKAAKVSIPKDGIHGQMISNLGKNGKEILLDIFNNSWKTGKLPQDWKTATIIPIKKLDKSADDPKNYRPISLT
ncbi:hypothetical protein LAZ67_15000963, partial [Cordylochernes scorpioides]